MRTTSILLLCLIGVLASASARAGETFTVRVELGPIKGRSNDVRSITFDEAALQQTRQFDIQDGREHIVRGVWLRDLVARLKEPKSADTVLFVYSDGMQIPVHLSDRKELGAIFIAMEEADAREKFSTTYPVQNKMDLTCPKVVYGRKATTYSIWLYPTQLASIRLVTWKLHEASLAQATRRVPDQSGWPLYLRHCQPCHGIGGQGAVRGPDFLSDMAAYRRVPPLAVTDVSQHPSLHEKVKGYTDGTMPVLNHISNAEIASLWRWLHGIHASATK